MLMTDATSQLLEAGSLMGLGMAFVFSFLSLVILAIKVLSRFAAEAAPVPAAAAPAAVATNGLSSQQLAAISAAIAQYKKNKNI
ncbi:OadG family protein [Zobellella maritima]|uniref:OadG family protein n=1 Tax=Zobellella maritima TaxID=2059725 RepID=UPI000E300A68|nr:OadG family transporter subunit [Zobellella maritima]